MLRGRRLARREVRQALEHFLQYYLSQREPQPFPKICLKEEGAPRELQIQLRTTFRLKMMQKSRKFHSTHYEESLYE